MRSCPRRIARNVALLVCATLCFASGPGAAPGLAAQGLRPVDILMLGDSQLAFGSGPAFVKFFKNFSKRCAGLGLPESKLRKVEAMSFGILGVRATGLHMWLSRSKKGTRMICVRDPAGYDNASTYGAMRYNKSRWVQIGESRHHRFCGSSRSPMENIMAQLPEAPKLTIFHFLGLSAYHWLKKSRLLADLTKVNKQLPMETSCLFVTTIPAYLRKINRPRIKAQAALEEALMDERHRCGFVAGQTKKTLGAFQGNPAYYYKRRDGRVKDPYHTTPAGAARFLAIRGPAICRGVVEALWPHGTKDLVSEAGQKDESQRQN